MDEDIRKWLSEQIARLSPASSSASKIRLIMFEGWLSELNDLLRLDALKTAAAPQERKVFKKPEGPSLWGKF